MSRKFNLNMEAPKKSAEFYAEKLFAFFESHFSEADQWEAEFYQSSKDRYIFDIPSKRTRYWFRCDEDGNVLQIRHPHTWDEEHVTAFRKSQNQLEARIALANGYCRLEPEEE